MKHSPQNSPSGSTPAKPALPFAQPSASPTKAQLIERVEEAYDESSADSLSDAAQPPIVMQHIQMQAPRRTVSTPAPALSGLSKTQQVLMMETAALRE